MFSDHTPISSMAGMHLLRPSLAFHIYHYSFPLIGLQNENC